MSQFNRQGSRVAWLSLSALIHGVALAAVTYGTVNSIIEIKNGLGFGEAGVEMTTSKDSAAGQMDAKGDVEIAVPAPVEAPVAAAPPPVAPVAPTAPKSAPKARATVLPAKIKTANTKTADNSSVDKQLEADAPKAEDDIKPIAVQTESAVAVEDKEGAKPEIDPAIAQQSKEEKAIADLQAKAAQDAEKQDEQIKAAELLAQREKLKAEEKAAAEARAMEAKARAEKEAKAASESPQGQAGQNVIVGQAVPQGVEIHDAGEFKPNPGNPNPKYPEADRISNREGKAVLVGEVKKDGTLSAVFIEQSSGSKTLDRASVEAFKKWRFNAGQEGFVRKPFEFRLRGETAAVGGGRLRSSPTSQTTE